VGTYGDAGLGLLGDPTRRAIFELLARQPCSVQQLADQQDIRRPLGLPRQVPADRLRCALDFGRTARPIGAKKRVQGLTLTATDLDWSAGAGPVVEGPAESLLMALAGRRGIVEELSGPGRPALAERIGG
jgi:DNA-binding transcriptional ArsR family regulator